jgi:prolipoprotein diacylglyceryltransferase
LALFISQLSILWYFTAITWDFDPEIFSIGNHGVRWYGFMIALGLLTGYSIFKRYLRGDKLSTEMVDSLLVYMAIAGIMWCTARSLFLLRTGVFSEESPGDPEDLERGTGKSRLGHWYPYRALALLQEI